MEVHTSVRHQADGHRWSDSQIVIEIGLRGGNVIEDIYKEEGFDLRSESRPRLLSALKRIDAFHFLNCCPSPFA